MSLEFHQSMKQIPLFVCGDENIFFPAVVALSSIERHNPGVFELYLCVDSSKVSADQRQLLTTYGIRLFDTRPLLKRVPRIGFRTLRETRWPLDLFVNWVVPEEFAKMGYRHSIKCDYDVLCVGKYDLDQLLVHGREFLSGLVYRSNLTFCKVPANVQKQLETDGRYNPKSREFINAGFVVFDNYQYTEARLLEEFGSVYRLLYESNDAIHLLEQTAFGICLSTRLDRLKPLDASYNRRVLALLETRDDLTFDAKNIHYITRNKPWKPINMKRLSRSVEEGQGALFAYRNMWLRYACGVEGFERYCDQRPLSDEESLGLMMRIIGLYEQRVDSLVRSEKRLLDKIRNATDALSTS